MTPGMDTDPNAAACFEARVLLLASQASGFTRITADSPSLVLDATFGTLEIPFARVSRLTRTVTGAIEVYATGATVLIETERPADASVLFGLLELKVRGHRKRFVSRDETRT